MLQQLQHKHAQIMKGMYHGAETENRCHHNLYTETHFALQIPNITSRGVFRVLEDF